MSEDGVKVLFKWGLISGSLFGAGLGFGFLVALALGTFQKPEVIIQDRWLYNTTTTIPRIPLEKGEDLSWLNNETPEECLLRGNNNCLPTTTTSVVPVPVPVPVPVSP